MEEQKENLNNKEEGIILRTLSGTINLDKPYDNKYELYDIASGLGNNSHWGGQVHFFFSIASHCLLTAELCRAAEFKDVKDEDMSLEQHYKILTCLMHDAEEGISFDLFAPFKEDPRFAFLKDMLDEVRKAIFTQYEIPEQYYAEIKKYDVQARNMEWDCLNAGHRYGVVYQFRHNPSDSRYIWFESVRLRLGYIRKKLEDKAVADKLKETK